MKNLNQYLEAYGESHQNLNNQKIHWLCVPLIEFCLLGLAAQVTVYADFSLAYFVLLFAGVFYYFLSVKVMALMLIEAIIYLWIITLTEWSAGVYFGLFVLAWIGQFIGHKIEGKKPSFFDDLKFLLIGPIWCHHSIYQRLFNKT